MHPDPDPDPDRSPGPIVEEATVPLPAAQAFVAFTAQMGEWWDPVLTPDPVSFSGVEIEPEGEVALLHGKDRVVIGEVTTWEPPATFEQTFRLGVPEGRSTTLRVGFDDDEGPDGPTTRVHLEHGGWTADTAQERERFTHWEDLLVRYVAHAAR